MSIPGKSTRGLASVTTALKPGVARTSRNRLSSAPTTQINASALASASHARVSPSLSGQPNRAIARARDGTGWFARNAA